ncbi:hypothetical protein QMA70_09195 [Burkholderia pseudomallei]|uniref:hypothetical protein n=1 Tax=Burkholderia pseudomallei TaxID=28450 RepID=UPI002DB981F1|nr:hypothetical protein [Burkholderia pseudomallei]MEB5509963.1 hypothetical protein [Burkholderia pseudomallei]
MIIARHAENKARAAANGKPPADAAAGRIRPLTFWKKGFPILSPSLRIHVEFMAFLSGGLESEDANLN